MKKLLYLAIGIVIGASIGFGQTTYAAVKQFILTEFNSPVVVNGVVYKDAQNPILNYNGKTYIPLAKIGELTGVNYTWNASKKQVEIGASNDNITYYTRDNNGKLRPIDAINAENNSINDFVKNNPSQVEKKAGLVEENGTKVLYLKTDSGKEKRLASEDDTDYVLAKINKEPLPPSIADGWINIDLLGPIYNMEDVDLSNIATKEYNGKTYYSINDLIEKGIIKI